MIQEVTIRDEIKKEIRLEVLKEQIEEIDRIILSEQYREGLEGQAEYVEAHRRLKNRIENEIKEIS